MTRDLQPLPPFQAPGALWPEEPFLKGEHPEGAPETRISASPLDRATWFDGSGPLDPTALGLLARGDFEGAMAIWSEHPESLHNRAILMHLLLFGNDQELMAWRQTFTNWCALATATGEEGYHQVVGELRQQLEAEAATALAEGRAGSVRWSLSILAAGLPPEWVERFQTQLSADDLERFSLACAAVRRQLLESTGSGNTAAATDMLRREVLPQANFLSASLLPGSRGATDVAQQMALLWRTIARSWADLSDQPNLAGRDATEARLQAMEDAFRWAPPTLKEELLPELEHLRWRGRAMGSRLASSELLTPKRTAGWTALVGAAACLLVGVLAYSTDLSGYSWYRSFRSPKVAVSRDIAATLSEIQAVVQELAKLDSALQNRTEKSAPTQWHRREALRQRHKQLVGELQRLENLRRQELRAQ